MILIVEDDADIRATLADVLHGEGFYTHEEPDGRDAMLWLIGASLEKSDMPELILLDLQMPHMDGVEFYKRMQTTPELAGIPVIVLSASGNIKGLEWYCDDMANMRSPESFAKPFDVDRLVARIHEITHG